MIRKRSFYVKTNVVESDIPVLLSNKSMKKADTEINFGGGTVNMFDVKRTVLVTDFRLCD